MNIRGWFPRKRNKDCFHLKLVLAASGLGWKQYECKDCHRIFSIDEAHKKDGRINL